MFYCANNGSKKGKKILLIIDECTKCSVLPICGGKCPIEWERQNKQKESGCIPDKQSISIKLNNLLK